MKQLKLFESESEHQDHIHWKLFIDGASRNNPGPSGAGIYILNDGELFQRDGYYLGNKTNNQAEYLACLVGLYFIKKSVDFKKPYCISVISDSQLLVRQLKGEYRVRNAELQPLYALAKNWVTEWGAQIFHVLRIENEEADAMANYGIDKKKKLPAEFLTILSQNEITI